MNLGELRAVFRNLAGDTAAPYLWSNEEIALHATQAEQEAAERARLIYDESIEIDLAPGESRYVLPASVLQVCSAWLVPRSRIDVVPHECLPETLSSGVPRQAAETRDGLLEVWPVPSAAGILHLGVFRLPNNPLQLDADEPEIHARHHYRLLDWMLRCAYLKSDADAQDERRAAAYEAAFERSFGARPDANVQRKQHGRHVPTVRVNW